MDFELEIFEVYDENEPHTSRKHSKHTRKKCKQKGKSPKKFTNIEASENDITRSKTSVHSGDRRHLSLGQSILNVFSKLVIWRGKKSKSAEKLDSPHTSKDFRRGYIPCGKLIGSKMYSGISRMYVVLSLINLQHTVIKENDLAIFPVHQVFVASLQSCRN